MATRNRRPNNSDAEPHDSELNDDAVRPSKRARVQQASQDFQQLEDQNRDEDGIVEKRSSREAAGVIGKTSPAPKETAMLNTTTAMEETPSVDISPRTQKILAALDTTFHSSNPLGSAKGADEITSSSRATKARKYDEGIHLFSVKKQISDDATALPTLISLLCDLGEVAFSQEDYLYAVRCFDLSLTRLLGDMTDSSGYWLIRFCLLFNRASCQYFLGQKDESLCSFQEALSVAKDQDMSLAFKARSLNAIGVVIFHINSEPSSKILETFNDALDAFQSFQKERSVEQATCWNNIGRVHFREKRMDAALDFYRKALHTRRFLLGKRSIDCAATICNIGQSHHQKGELAEALACYQIFLSMALQMFPYNFRDISTVFKLVAEIQMKNGHVDSAQRSMERAILHGKQVPCGFEAEMASMLNWMGNLYFERNDMEKALKFYNEGLVVQRKSSERDNTNIIITLMNCAQAHRQSSNFQSALESYQEVYNIRVEADESQTLEHASVLSNIGLMHYNLKEYSKANDAFQMCLHIQRDHHGSDRNLDVASTMNLIGLSCFGYGAYTRSRECFFSCLQTRQRLLGQDHEEVAIVLYNIATVLMETGEEDRATSFYEETLRIERNILGPDHDDVILTLQHMGLVAQKQGDFDSSIAYFSEALVGLRKKDKNKANVAKVLNLLGNTHLQLANIPRMMECYAESVSSLMG